MSQFKKYQNLEKQLKILPQKYKATVNLRVYAGVAKPSPKMGQALGPLGINMMQFCKVIYILTKVTQAFNEKTQNIRTDVPLKVQNFQFHDKAPRNFMASKKSFRLAFSIHGSLKEQINSQIIRVTCNVISLVYKKCTKSHKQKKNWILISLMSRYNLLSNLKQIIDQTKSLGVAVTIQYIKPKNNIKPPVKV